MVNKDAWLDLILILKKVAVTSEVRKEQEYETKSNRQKVTQRIFALLLKMGKKMKVHFAIDNTKDLVKWTRQ